MYYYSLLQQIKMGFKTKQKKTGKASVAARLRYSHAAVVGKRE
jgi:hypothetical protein